MLNCIKMDLYRMFRMKSFYMIWIILAAATIFTTSMSVIDYNMLEEEAQNSTQTLQQESTSLYRHSFAARRQRNIKTHGAPQ